MGFESDPCCVATSKMTPGAFRRIETPHERRHAFESDRSLDIIAGMCGRFTLRTPARDLVEDVELLRGPGTPRAGRR